MSEETRGQTGIQGSTVSDCCPFTTRGATRWFVALQRAAGLPLLELTLLFQCFLLTFLLL